MRVRGLSIAVMLVALLAGAAGGARAAVTASKAVKAKPSRGCQHATVAPGEEKVTMTSGGTERWYIRHVPPAADGKHPLPLVVDLHGYSEGADIHTRLSMLGTYGDAHRFVTITPQGTGSPVRWDTTLGSADVRFIGDLLDHAEQTLCIDERRVFVTGLSNGAFMTSAVACAYADRFAAAAPVAGIRDIAHCKPARRVPVVAFHGTADPFVSFDGGLGPAAANLPAPDGSGKTLGQEGIATSAAAKGPSIPKITAAWAKRNGCVAKPTERAVASDVTLVRFRCPAGADVELYRIAGGGHAWPGSEFSKEIASVVGKTTFSISADDIIWKFFEAHPLRRD